MRSLADRRLLELGLRSIAWAGLAWLLAGAFAVRHPAGRMDQAGDRLPLVLRGWSLNPPADSLSVHLTGIPARALLDWLVALRRAGTHISWSQAGMSPLALEVEPRGDPAGGALIRVGGAPGRTIVLRDQLGILDSLSLGPVGGTAMVPAAEGLIAAFLGPDDSATAVAMPEDSLRRVLVLGGAGWESKFVVAALVERGWVVDARLAVAPRLAVLTGRPAAIDTATYAAVVVLDSTAASQANAIFRYVHSGGGLLLGPDAVGFRAFRDLLPAGPGHDVTASGLPVVTVGARADLSILDLAPLRLNAVALEEVRGHLVAAARRFGSGRVLALGLRDTWRWRMQGGAGAVAEHRAWWAGNVAAVAYLPVARFEEESNPAPLASLYQALGPPASADSGARPVGSPSWIVLLVVMVSLLGEWASRRFRGAV